MIIEAEDYVEHFGVRGMHWGVRNAANKASVGAGKAQLKSPPNKVAAKSGRKLGKKLKNMTPEQKRKAIIIGSTGVVGALWVANHAMKNRQIKLRQARQSAAFAKGLDEFDNVLKDLAKNNPI
jgi:hypothetical protein